MAQADSAAPGASRAAAGGGASASDGPGATAPAHPLPPDRTQSILEAAKRVGALLKAAPEPFALAGSVAAYAHGVATGLQHDADFCVRREDADAVAATLRRAGIEVRHPPEDWLIKARCGGAEVDLIFELAHRPITREVLDRAEVLSVDSVRMPVLTATDLVGSLIAAFSEHHCDFGAVLPVARTLREKVDWDRLRRDLGADPMPAAFFYLLERLDVIDRSDRSEPSEGAP
ncbi:MULTISPECIES: nucleotidyltransferase family protein [Streptomycetaceae]|uniref:nucleotidyltransferase family protein n=1 Tax=Streptomycetaceae TaxID=2062 RepID=UPI001E341AC6|nr:nucleotidyltransferase family protein [Streptantibioticus cattleyicolor]